MEFPECQKCGAKLARFSRRKQFAECAHCGTLHNVSNWFSDATPPLIVKSRTPTSGVVQYERGVLLQLSLIATLVGLGLVALSFLQDRDHHLFSPMLELVVGLVVAAAGATVLISVLLRRR